MRLRAQRRPDYFERLTATSELLYPGTDDARHVARPTFPVGARRPRGGHALPLMLDFAGPVQRNCAPLGWLRGT